MADSPNTYHRGIRQQHKHADNAIFIVHSHPFVFNRAPVEHLM